MSDSAKPTSTLDDVQGVGNGTPHEKVQRLAEQTLVQRIAAQEAYISNFLDITGAKIADVELVERSEQTESGGIELSWFLRPKDRVISNVDSVPRSVTSAG